MSISTWKKEFYGPMGKAVKSEKAALEHSIKKWTGLLPANLKKHQISVNGWDDLRDESGKIFSIDATTCALCNRYSDCDTCPIDDCTAPAYMDWLKESNPRPMLKLLKQALKKCG